VTQKDEIIAVRDETILHQEDQINESDHIITQRNTIIEFLQEQIHDLILEADDAQAHLEELQQQPIPPAAPAEPEAEEEDPEEIEGISELDSEHGDPVLSPHHSSSGSQSFVGKHDRVLQEPFRDAVVDVGASLCCLSPPHSYLPLLVFEQPCLWLEPRVEPRKASGQNKPWVSTTATTTFQPSRGDGAANRTPQSAGTSTAEPATSTVPRRS
jgi:hypothetical protein